LFDNVQINIDDEVLVGFAEFTLLSNRETIYQILKDFSKFFM